MKSTTSRDFFTFLRARSAEIIDEAGLNKKLDSGRTLRVKLGTDPTTPDLHLGHIVPLRMLRAFQDAGHHAVLIIGDFTGQIGDPSGKARTRRQMTPEEAKANERTYHRQISKVLDMRNVEIRHNSEWYKTIKLGDFLKILSQFSLKSAWERDDFQKRIKAGKEVRLHEAMYPVLQAYDSVMVRSDVELGSLDQKLNILAGRELQKKLGQHPQDTVLLPYLIGLDGKQKMSKSVGNTINLSDSAGEMLGKIMSIPDGLIMNYAELAAWFATEELVALGRRLKKKENPRDIKLDVAEAVVGLYHGVLAAKKARENFLKLFSKKEVPASPASGRPRDSIPSVRLPAKSYNPLELLKALKAVNSNSEARRLLKSRAVEIDGRTIEYSSRQVLVSRGSIIRVGKKKFFRVI